MQSKLVKYCIVYLAVNTPLTNTPLGYILSAYNIPLEGIQRRLSWKELVHTVLENIKRIEGQVRGVEGMLESDAYCTDILIQVSAISSALKSFNKVLLANHMKTCVAEGIRKGDDSVIDEFVVTLQKLMK